MFSLIFCRFLQALTYNCLTMRESTLVSIHETVVTVYMRALSHCHAISQLQQVSLVCILVIEHLGSRLF